ncbi:cytochrome P450 [Gymnopus androsaceus JB14]|uniref:Cytochrome P450 n=1 Tax=Gymnopus androsaceus JB14 TaxID=1447944 RepID=A0A6A4HYY6_9AGAR|nr:cytochrome P450 [Gymnopus androsaceus JB14]
MFSLLQVLTYAGGSLVVYGSISLVRLLYGEYTSTLRNLPGPPSPSWLFGNFKQIQETENNIFHEKWVREYGPTMRYKFLLSTSRLYTTDTKALSHVLLNTQIYERSELTRWILNRVTGPGLLSVEKETHKAQRRIANPAFGPAQLREFTKTFFEKSDELRDIWMSEIEAQGNGIARIDATAWLNMLTLDVVGRTGFNYDFHALKGNSEINELSKAFSVVFSSAFRVTPWMVVQKMVPVVGMLSPDGAAVRHARRTMERIGQQFLSESKAFVKAAGENADTFRSKDLLTLLVRSNMSKGIPDDQRISDEEVVAQIPAFLAAGHETTSTSMVWSLYALTQHKSVQDKLRQELLSVPTESLTMEELNSLPYLDAVVRESLRMYPAAPSAVRVAVKDDILPLSMPIIGRNGNECNHIRQNIDVPILAVHLSKELWGEDATEFKPERWEKLPEAVASIPGVWGNILTFIGGPHNCIGYRFAVLEMKAFLFSMVRAFELDLAVPSEEIIARRSIVRRPYVSSQMEAGSQLPLLVKLYSRS